MYQEFRPNFPAALMYILIHLLRLGGMHRNMVVGDVANGGGHGEIEMPMVLGWWQTPCRSTTMLRHHRLDLNSLKPTDL